METSGRVRFSVHVDDPTDNLVSVPSLGNSKVTTDIEPADDENQDHLIVDADDSPTDNTNSRNRIDYFEFYEESQKEPEDKTRETPEEIRLSYMESSRILLAAKSVVRSVLTEAIRTFGYGDDQIEVIMHEVKSSPVQLSRESSSTDGLQDTTGCYSHLSPSAEILNLVQEIIFSAAISLGYDASEVTDVLGYQPIQKPEEGCNKMSIRRSLNYEISDIDTTKDKAAEKSRVKTPTGSGISLTAKLLVETALNNAMLSLVTSEPGTSLMAKQLAENAIQRAMVYLTPIGPSLKSQAQAASEMTSHGKADIEEIQSSNTSLLAKELVQEAINGAVFLLNRDTVVLSQDKSDSCLQADSQLQLISLARDLAVTAIDNAAGSLCLLDKEQTVCSPQVSPTLGAMMKVRENLSFLDNEQSEVDVHSPENAKSILSAMVKEASLVENAKEIISNIILQAAVSLGYDSKNVADVLQMETDFKRKHPPETPKQRRRMSVQFDESSIGKSLEDDSVIDSRRLSIKTRVPTPHSSSTDIFVNEDEGDYDQEVDTSFEEQRIDISRPNGLYRSLSSITEEDKISPRKKLQMMQKQRLEHNQPEPFQSIIEDFSANDQSEEVTLKQDNRGSTAPLNRGRRPTPFVSSEMHCKVIQNVLRDKDFQNNRKGKDLIAEGYQNDPLYVIEKVDEDYEEETSPNSSHPVNQTYYKDETNDKEICSREDILSDKLKKGKHLLAKQHAENSIQGSMVSFTPIGPSLEPQDQAASEMTYHEKVHDTNVGDEENVPNNKTLEAILCENFGDMDETEGKRQNSSGPLNISHRSTLFISRGSHPNTAEMITKGDLIEDKMEGDYDEITEEEAQDEGEDESKEQGMPGENSAHFDNGRNETNDEKVKENENGTDVMLNMEQSEGKKSKSVEWKLDESYTSREQDLKYEASGKKYRRPTPYIKQHIDTFSELRRGSSINEELEKYELKSASDSGIAKKQTNRDLRRHVNERRPKSAKEQRHRVQFDEAQMIQKYPSEGELHQTDSLASGSGIKALGKGSDRHLNKKIECAQSYVCDLSYDHPRVVLPRLTQSDVVCLTARNEVTNQELSMQTNGATKTDISVLPRVSSYSSQCGSVEKLAKSLSNSLVENKLSERCSSTTSLPKIHPSRSRMMVAISTEAVEGTYPVIFDSMRQQETLQEEPSRSPSVDNDETESVMCIELPDENGYETTALEESLDIACKSIPTEEDDLGQTDKPTGVIISADNLSQHEAEIEQIESNLYDKRVASSMSLAKVSSINSSSLSSQKQLGKTHSYPKSTNKSVKSVSSLAKISSNIDEKKTQSKYSFSNDMFTKTSTASKYSKSESILPYDPHMSKPLVSSKSETTGRRRVDKGTKELDLTSVPSEQSSPKLRKQSETNNREASQTVPTESFLECPLKQESTFEAVISMMSIASALDRFNVPVAISEEDISQNELKFSLHHSGSWTIVDVVSNNNIIENSADEETLSRNASLQSKEEIGETITSVADVEATLPAMGMETKSFSEPADNKSHLNEEGTKVVAEKSSLPRQPSTVSQPSVDDAGREISVTNDASLENTTEVDQASKLTGLLSMVISSDTLNNVETTESSKKLKTQQDGKEFQVDMGQYSDRAKILMSTSEHGNIKSLGLNEENTVKDSTTNISNSSIHSPEKIVNRESASLEKITSSQMVATKRTSQVDSTPMQKTKSEIDGKDSLLLAKTSTVSASKDKISDKSVKSPSSVAAARSDMKRADSKILDESILKVTQASKYSKSEASMMSKADGETESPMKSKSEILGPKKSFSPRSSKLSVVENISSLSSTAKTTDFSQSHMPEKNTPNEPLRRSSHSITSLRPRKSSFGGSKIFVTPAEPDVDFMAPNRESLSRTDSLVVNKSGSRMSTSNQK